MDADFHEQMRLRDYMQQVGPSMQIEPPKSMIIDLDAIKRSLYDQDRVRSRIARDFGISETATGPKDFTNAVVAALDQRCADHPLEQSHSNRDVFRAAARSVVIPVPGLPSYVLKSDWKSCFVGSIQSRPKSV